MKLEEIAKIMMEEHHETAREFIKARAELLERYWRLHEGEGIDENNELIREMRNYEHRSTQELAAYYALKDILEKYESGWTPDDEEE